MRQGKNNIYLYDKVVNNMLDLPVWLTSAVPVLHCPHCNEGMKPGGILSIGIRSSARNRNNTVLFFEYECNSCQNRSIFEMNDMTLNEFAACVYNKKAPAETPPKQDVKVPAPKREQKSKISDIEAKKAVDWIESCDKNFDFLLGIGLSRNEISNYLSDSKNGEDRK